MKKLPAFLAFSVLLFAGLAGRAAAAVAEIRLKNSDPAVAYAGAELAKYLARMDAGHGSAVIELGLFEDCGVTDFPATPDRTLDDAIVVDVKNGRGVIAGANPRSVVQGVYRFLWELGCRWVRPGPSGEIVPAVDANRMTVLLREAASNRNRTICIEGAVSLTNVLELIEWMPKVGFNGFMMQFRDGYVFFDRWYSHEDNPRLKRAEPIDRGVAQEYTALIEQEVQRRGLIYHAVGHGWTLETFGIPALGWMMRFDLPRDFLAHIALVNGDRTVPWNIPNLAALCYSDPVVQSRLIACIADYAQAHGHVDYLHVWLEDGTNGKCECEVCRTKRPSDFYVQILNRLDAELTARKLRTRIVFIAYSDLLWTPLSERLKNPARFSFLYANSRADYTRALDPADVATPLQPFQLNRVPARSNSNAHVVAYLHDWEKIFSGERLLFEYYGGAETVTAARVVWQDVRNLSPLGLSGLVNCQALRVFFPNGLGMVALGRTLWNSRLEFEDIADDYFRGAYGADGKTCYEFTAQSQQSVTAIQKQLKADHSGVPAAAATLRTAIDRFSPVVARNLAGAAGDTRDSWRMMSDYLKVLDYFVRYAEAQVQEEGQGAELIRYRFQQFVFSLEEKYQPYLQSGEFFGRYMK